MINNQNITRMIEDGTVNKQKMNIIGMKDASGFVFSATFREFFDFLVTENGVVFYQVGDEKEMAADASASAKKQAERA